jgi:hypothetical protein
MDQFQDQVKRNYPRTATPDRDRATKEGPLLPGADQACFFKQGNEAGRCWY